jgi:hypothetical protein
MAVPGSGVQVSGAEADLTRAWYSDLTSAYDHGILGDSLEPSRLHAWSVATSAQCGLSAEAGQGHVFEDIAPRLADVDGDGQAEVIAIRSSIAKGAQLAVYRAASDGRTLDLIATSPYIGRTHRWLAPIGIADIDGDGRVEIPIVDRPHLARVLQIWEWRDGGLHLEAQMEGVTNHRIGDDWISGGIRDCGQGPQMVVLSPDWREVRAVSWDGETFRMGSLGPNRGRGSVEAMLTCN